MANPSNVLKLNLSRPQALQLIREIAQDSDRVKFVSHAKARMNERGITDMQVLRCLRRGRIIEGPSRSTKGNWEMRMEALSAGDVVTAAIALDHDEDGNMIIVITVF